LSTTLHAVVAAHQHPQTHPYPCTRTAPPDSTPTFLPAHPPQRSIYIQPLLPLPRSLTDYSYSPTTTITIHPSPPSF
jgi:hypothetical protein